MSAPQEYAERKTDLKKDIAFLVLKLLIFIPLTYTFIRYESFYTESRRLYNLAYAVNTFLTGNIVIYTCRILVIFWYIRRSKYVLSSTRGSFVLGINRIASVINVVLIIVSLMLLFGIDPKEFLTSITLVAMAVTLIFKDYVTNMISGLLIMFNDQLTLGDSIKLGEHQGKIIDITLINIVLSTEEDDIVMIPNNLVFTTNIVNQSLQHSRKVSVEFELPLNHVLDWQVLKQKISDVLKEQSNEVVEDSLKLKVMALQKDAVHYKAQFILTNRGKLQSQFIKNLILNEIIQNQSDLP